MDKEDPEFDFQKALKDIQNRKPLLGQEGILIPLVKKLTEPALEAELESNLGRGVAVNRRNG